MPETDPRLRAGIQAARRMRTKPTADLAAAVLAAADAVDPLRASSVATASHQCPGVAAMTFLTPYRPEVRGAER